MPDDSNYKEDCIKFLQKLIQTPSVDGQDNEEKIVQTYGEKQKSLIIGQRGLIRLKIVCRGEAVHSGSLEWQKKEEGKNANEEIVSQAFKLAG